MGSVRRAIVVEVGPRGVPLNELQVQGSPDRAGIVIDAVEAFIRGDLEC